MPQLIVEWFIYLFLSLLCLFVLLVFVCGCWFCFYFLLAYFLLCGFKFVFSFPLILSAVFISLWVGLDLNFSWSENKISYFGAAYKYLSRGIELAVIKELFILCLYMSLCNIFTIHMCLLFIHGFNTWLCASLCDCNLNVYIWGPQTLLDKVDETSSPLNLSNKRTCLWLKLIHLLWAESSCNSTCY